MLRRNLLLFSLTLNIFFIFFFTSNLQRSTLDELSEGLLKLITPTPVVIGVATEDGVELSKVVRVVDGDTIALENGKTLRYIGIDTPEKFGNDECFSSEATSKNEELVLGKKIRLEKDVSETDRYGRLLRYVFVNDEFGKEVFVNEYLVRNGYAFSVTFPPDLKHSDFFRQAEKEARDKHVGLWNKCPEQIDNSQ